MNANENLERKREKAAHEFGLFLLGKSVVLLLITLSCFYRIISPTHLRPSEVAKAIVVLGFALISISIVLLLITPFSFHAILIPAHQGPLDLCYPLFLEELMFLSGCLLFSLSLPVGLIGWFCDLFDNGTGRKLSIAECGLVFVRISLVLSLITLFCLYAILVPAHQGYGNGMVILAIDSSLFIGALVFVPGCLLLLIGLLIGLIGLLKKQESR
jgi:hypothetical protein